MVLLCKYCQFNFDDIKKYIFHLETTHHINNYFVCPYEKCKRTYNTKSSFKYHLNAGNDLHGSSVDSSSTSSASNFTHNTADGRHVTSIVDTSPTEPLEPRDLPDQCDLSSQEKIKQNLVLFLCNLYNNISLPRSVVQTIFESVENLINSLTSEIDKTAKNSEHDPITKIGIITNILSDIKISFDSLNTEYKRMKHFTTDGNYIQPKTVILGTTTDRITVNENIVMTLKERKLYVIPLKLQLQVFLELPGVLTEICNYQRILLSESDDNNKIIRNIVQGTLWKEILSSKPKEDITLPIILYFDDFESGNPLGSHAGQYKLGAVYVSIATIPPNMSSRLENIFLTQLFYSKDRVHFGNALVFRTLIEELKNLEEVGITVKLTDMSVTVKFVLTVLSGDNLGLHSIMGLYESFMATNFCRICLITKTDSETQIEQDNDLLRKVPEYENDVLNRKGIKEVCVWNDLPSFHIYENQTLDVMHDLMEGVHRYAMAHVIASLIEKQYFSLDQLNSRLKYSEYHSCEKNKPPPINSQHLINKHITMSATEMLCLVRNFVFIVGDLVNADEPIWTYYLLLLEITNILTSQTFTYELLDYLQSIISEHHQQYLNLFQSTLKPKHHFLLHYPTIIKKIGPPILVSAFKYESKHKELKKVCQSITSRIDLPLSVIKRCQLQQRLKLTTKKGLIDNVYHGKLVGIETNQDEAIVTFSVEWYECNGIRYNVNDVISCESDDSEGEPQYYQIDKIYYRADVNEVMFGCFYLRSLFFNPHFKAYKVEKTRQTKMIKYKDLYDNQPTIVHNVGLDYYVKLG